MTFLLQDRERVNLGRITRNKSLEAIASIYGDNCLEKIARYAESFAKLQDVKNSGMPFRYLLFLVGRKAKVVGKPCVTKQTSVDSIGGAPQIGTLFGIDRVLRSVYHRGTGMHPSIQER
jgi:hypothetical protein